MDNNPYQPPTTDSPKGKGRLREMLVVCVAFGSLGIAVAVFATTTTLGLPITAAMSPDPERTRGYGTILIAISALLSFGIALGGALAAQAIRRGSAPTDDAN